MSLLDALQTASGESLEVNFSRYLNFVGWKDGELVEMQALDVPQRAPVWLNGRQEEPYQRAGHYAARASTSEELMKLAKEGDALGAQGVYVLLNEVKPGVQHRNPFGRWYLMGKGDATKDDDMLKRRLGYFDLDPERADGVKGISSTAEETAIAVARGEQVAALISRYIPSQSLGFVFSGNGLGVVVAMEPHDPKLTTGKLKAVLLGASMLLSDGQAKVDTSVYDPKRLGPCPGTTKRKGHPSAERPHRQTAFIGPESPHRISLEEFDKLVVGVRSELTDEQCKVFDEAMGETSVKPKASPVVRRQSGAYGSTGHSPGFAIANRVPIHEVLGRLSMLDGENPVCPGCHESDQGVNVFENGLKCFHDRCANKGYRGGFRTVVDVVMEALQVNESGAMAWLRTQFPDAGIPEKKSASQRGVSSASRRKHYAPPQVNAPHQSEHKPTIQISSELHENVDAGIAALVSRKDLYTRGGGLVQLIIDPSTSGVTTASLRPVPRATLREMLTSVADWQRFDPRAKTWCSTVPGDNIVQAIESRGQWPNLRTVSGVVQTPFMRSDGSVCDQQGYDPQSTYILHYEGHFPPVAEQPTRDHAGEALACILDLYSDFPFVDAPSRYVAVALLLTLLCRPGLGRANTPAFLFDANTPGTGKTLVADTTAIIATGREVPKSAWRNNEEMEKVLGAAALEGTNLLAFDNIDPKFPFAGSAIDMVLTCSGNYKPRILGKSETPTLQWAPVIVGTGNNILVEGDTRRRVIISRQESRLERPEDRSDFRYPNLREVARVLRPELVHAGLTILRAHAVAGRPLMVRKMGSFEKWAEFVPSAIVWAGGADVLSTTLRAENDDPTQAAVKVMLRSWPSLDPTGKGLRLGELADKLYRSTSSYGAPVGTMNDGYATLREALELLAPVRGAGAVRFDPQRLGKVLRRERGRNFDGRAFMDGSLRQGAQTWRVVDATTLAPILELEEGVRGIEGVVRATQGQDDSFSRLISHAVAPLQAVAHPFIPSTPPVSAVDLGTYEHDTGQLEKESEGLEDETAVSERAEEP